jgi:cell division protein FtsI/penicillin-binding protein 2
MSAAGLWHAIAGALPHARLVFASPIAWIAAGALFSALAGAALIVLHAQRLAGVANGRVDGPDRLPVQAFQAAMPGAVFSVPAAPGIYLQEQSGGTVLIATGANPGKPVRVDLCSQLREPGGTRLLPLRIGARFSDVARWVERNRISPGAVTLRNVMLVNEPGKATDDSMPLIQIGGVVGPGTGDSAGQPLELSWEPSPGAGRGPRATVRWIGDAGSGRIVQGAAAKTALRQQGWLVWGEGAALRIERRASAGCPRAGELVLQLMRITPQADTWSSWLGATVGRTGNAAARQQRAQVTIFPVQGRAHSAMLLPGLYQVPRARPAMLEDEALLIGLQARGLLRLAPEGVIQVAPPDLALWTATDGANRAAQLADWQSVRLDADAMRLLRRLYREADGAYLRQQIDIFNNERQLLAWRGRPGRQNRPWQVSQGATPVPAAATATGSMPLASARLFADLPQGWEAWTRLAHWQAGRSGQPVTLTLALDPLASANAPVELMLVGRVSSIEGAQLHTVAACSGRACAAPDSVQRLLMTPLAGARAIALQVQPLSSSALLGASDSEYRHLRVSGGQLAWQTLQTPAGLAGTPRVGMNGTRPESITVEDRHGTVLWQNGQPTRRAAAAGLAPMLGLNGGQRNSIAGMLARAPSAGAVGQISSRLALDLPLQELTQQALDCIGMQHGSWEGEACRGGHAPPAGRRAGMVILDAETGDVLAAAGASTAAPNRDASVMAANWNEVRDFDRTNPARSPLRLPAFQHDGGALQSPGSTFKVISALGLELAATHDRQLDSLLDGLPLATINGLARQRGFDFATDAAVYPAGVNRASSPEASRTARITNYHSQGLDRRAHNGRLGMEQALTYSLNTWFAWAGELSDRSLFGRPAGGAPDLQALDADALDQVRPIVAAARMVGFESPLRMDGGLLPADFSWSPWDVLQATPSHIDAVHTRHELRQMAIGLRMQATPLQMALVSAAIGQAQVPVPRLLLTLGEAHSETAPARPLGVRLDRIRAGMKGVIEDGTARSAFADPALAHVRSGLYGKTGTAPTGTAPDGKDEATVWFTGWLEPGSLPGQTRRLAVAAFVSHSEGSGGEHAAPIVAAVLVRLARQPGKQSFETQERAKQGIEGKSGR